MQKLELVPGTQSLARWSSNATGGYLARVVNRFVLFLSCFVIFCSLSQPPFCSFSFFGAIMAVLAPRSSGEPVDKSMAYAHQVRATYNGEDEHEMADVMVAKKWQGTEVDRKDMSQLGKVQELRVRDTVMRVCGALANNIQRNFHFLSILGFGMSLMLLPTCDKQWC